MLIDAERSAFDLDSMIADHDQPAVAAITIAELGVGIEIATGRRRLARRAFLDDLVSSLPILDYDVDVALCIPGYSWPFGGVAAPAEPTT